MGLKANCLSFNYSKIEQWIFSKLHQVIPMTIVDNKNLAISTVTKVWYCKHKSEHHSPRVKGSIPVRGNFFAEFILL